MRLLKFLLGILLLRRLPGGRVVSWLIRLGILSWLIRQAIRKLRPTLTETPARAGMQAPSGWTSTAESAAPVEAYESVNLSATITATPPASAAGATEIVETVTETISESTKVWGAPAEATSGLEPDEPYVPRWVNGNGMLDCPDDFPIKAKANSNIYYVPGTYHYSVAIPDVCFAAPEDAAAAGYRPPRR